MLPIAVLMAIAFGLREVYEVSDSAIVQAILSTMRNMIHISLLFLWVISLHRRLMNKNVRHLMLYVGCLLIFWLVDKIIKWDFTGSVTHPLVRYLWYGFYVGMLFVPTLGAFIINYLGKPENYIHPKKLNYLLIPPTIMLIAVFTNDLHQKVFVFYNGFINLRTTEFTPVIHPFAAYGRLFDLKNELKLEFNKDENSPYILAAGNENEAAVLLTGYNKENLTLKLDLKEYKGKKVTLYRLKDEKGFIALSSFEIIDDIIFNLSDNFIYYIAITDNENSEILF